MKRILFIIFWSIFLIGHAAAQTIQVIDFQTKEALVGVNISCFDQGVITDENGNADLSILSCESVTISYVGYQTITALKSNLSPQITLKATINELDITTVTASRYERSLSESTVSVDVIKPALLQSINTTTGSEVLNKLPGVQVVGGQANIRGGSGFSYGAGSRVMILIDDIPALQADAGYANWGDMPIEHLGQIEVLKGAASAMYGSAALNGIVNFRRATPTTTPVTQVFTSGTYFADPKDLRSKWWADTTMRYRANAGFSHASKQGKWDVGMHGFVGKLESFNKDTYENKVRVGANTKYYHNERLQLSFNTMLNYVNASDFFLWGNAIREIYKPFSGTISSGKRLRFMIDPSLKYKDGHGNQHKVMTRFFYTDNNNNNNQSNSSITTYGEYQFQKNIEEIGLTMTSGLVGTVTDTKAELFGNANYLYRNFALYLQGEKSFNDRLMLAAGVRYEHNRQDSPTMVAGFEIPGGKVKDGAIISRFGLNYKLHEYSSLRLSWGQGYRYPTVTERFVNTSFGGFQISPNPLLQPEYGYTAEVGIKQGFALNAFKGFFDLSGFVSAYKDMIEFSFETMPYGFRPINVGNTKITGFEGSLIGKFNIWKIPITTITGYTYINPIYKDFASNTAVSSSVSSGLNVLKYRSKHSAKADVEANYLGIMLGFAWQYYSNVVNIDKQLEEPVEGLDLFEIGAFRRLNDGGFGVIDFRIGYQLKSLKITLIGANLQNKLYTVRPGLAEAPKNYTVRLDYQF
ncbi:MAG: TonB-dependent receptor [Saprospiraceae bacterium]|nr:TonB-dependent receptor [Saprospiraceae bacterium]